MKLIEGLGSLWETARTVIPITALLVFFQLVILRKPIVNVKNIIAGFFLSIFGLHFFLKGVSLSLLPLGDSVGKNLVILKHKWVIILFSFILGYTGTLVEPGLKALALEVEEISIGAISEKVLIQTVAVGFGFGMALGIFKILNNIPNFKIIAPLTVVVFILLFFVPEEFIAIAMDSASSTTGPVNIPLNMAIALGLSKIMDSSDPLMNGFGIIGLTSLGAMISVLILGLISKL